MFMLAAILILAAHPLPYAVLDRCFRCLHTAFSPTTAFMVAAAHAYFLAAFFRQQAVVISCMTLVLHFTPELYCIAFLQAP